MKHYTQAQLNAISKSYARKRQAEREAEAKAKGLDIVFKYGTYKRLDALLRAKPERLEKEIEIATENARNRVKQLEKCGCTSDTIARAREDLKKLEGMKK